MRLSATAAKQAKPKDKPYKLSDEKGMFLLVNPNGSKYWRLKYRFAGKEKTLALGVFPDVSLADAREARDDARKLLAKTIDPGAVKRTEKATLLQGAANSFEVVATEWFEKKMATKSESHRVRTWRCFKNDLFPPLAKRPINEITPQELLRALRRIEDRGAIETAHRAKQAAGQVFRYAVASGRADRDPSIDLKDALQTRQKKHFPAITEPREVGKLLLSINYFQGTPVVKAALQLSPLLFCRPGELRHMEWEEINWEEDRWEIPPTKMKIKQPHIVPLPRQALSLLRETQNVPRQHYLDTLT